MVKVFAFGKGPGPKNVGLILDDGTKTVVAYRTYKYKYSEGVKMAEAKKTYVTAIGFVQFDPNEREANGKSLTDVTIKTPGGEGAYIKVTIWPEFDLSVLDTPIAKGDLVAADGAFESSTYQNAAGETKTGLQISAFNLNVNGKRIPRSDSREVVQGAKPASSNVPF